MTTAHHAPVDTDAHDRGLDLAQQILDGMEAADDDAAAVTALHQVLLDLAEQMAAAQPDERYMVTAGLATGLYIQILDGMRHQAAAVLLTASMKASS
jgi:hypothetical protein